MQTFAGPCMLLGLCARGSFICVRSESCVLGVLHPLGILHSFPPPLPRGSLTSEETSHLGLSVCFS